MAGLAALAAKIGAAAVASHHYDVPIAILEFGDIHYDIRAVTDSTGLGGSPPYCAPGEVDFVMVTYMVTNRGDHTVPANAVPRVVLIDQFGQAHARDKALSDMVEIKGSPLLSFRHGELAAHESQTVADVFVTARNATRYNPYKLRPAPVSAQAYKLPQTRGTVTTDCPRPPRLQQMEPEAGG